jgi:energy-converting hydrogenase Eha subunit E
MEKLIVAGSHGRLLFWTGIGLFVLGVVSAIVQYALKQLIVPWYAPVLATVGVGLLLISCRQQPTIVRCAGLGLVALGCAFEWYVLLVSTRMPQYTGPAQVGYQVPAFTALRADGSSFTDTDLKQGPPTALVFFRGRW